MGRPKPKRLIHCEKRVAPSFIPIVTAPTLEDWARISEVVRVTGPRGCDSPIVRSATWIWGGRSNVVVGLTVADGSAFWAPANLANVLTATVVLGLAALGQHVVVLSGGIDLAVGSTATLSVR